MQETTRRTCKINQPKGCVNKSSLICFGILCPLHTVIAHCRINDVVVTGPETFYATNWLASRSQMMSLLQNLILRLAWSNVFLYDRGSVRIVADGMRLANGINMSPDKK